MFGFFCFNAPKKIQSPLSYTERLEVQLDAFQATFAIRHAQRLSVHDRNFRFYAVHFAGRQIGQG